MHSRQHPNDPAKLPRPRQYCTCPLPTEEQCSLPVLPRDAHSGYSPLIHALVFAILLLHAPLSADHSPAAHLCPRGRLLFKARLAGSCPQSLDITHDSGLSLCSIFPASALHCTRLGHCIDSCRLTRITQEEVTARHCLPTRKEKMPFADFAV